MKKFAGSVNPMNSLNGNKNSRFSRSSPSHSRSSPPPAKRQKVDEDNIHTRSGFAPIDLDEIPGQPSPRKRSFDNYSDSQQTLKSQSSNPKVANSASSNIPEFRSSENYVKVRPKKRRRYNMPESSREQPNTVAGVALLRPDAGDSDEEEVQMIQNPNPGAATIPSEKEKKDSRWPIDHYIRRFQKTPAAVSVDKAIDSCQHQGKKKTAENVESSPDELAPKAQDIKARVPTRRPVSPSPSFSPSLSKRGDLSRTNFSASSQAKPRNAKRAHPKSDLDRATAIIDTRLRITHAVSGSLKYEAKKVGNEDECFLKLRGISSILQPSSLNGDLMKKYSYCTINLTKVSAIEYSSDPGCNIVAIDRSVDATISGGPKLTVEFTRHEDLDHFVEWARMEREDIKRPKINPADPSKLVRTLSHALNVAYRSVVIMDDKSHDISLIKHNVADRAMQAKSTASQMKAKDSMKAPVSTSSSNPKATVISDDPQHHNRRPVRITRSTFTLRSPIQSESPEPDAWTVNNSGWGKCWRNSIIFPPHGKNRATVDKEDIPRLDEGQFLNDNLIIFYLRYLQHSLEAKRPDLAQRIYFQNTYFYEKLKSPKANQAINYDSVKAWTSKVDLFTKDYIIVPINEFSHWYVAIIYNAPKLLPSSDNVGTSGAHSKDTITIEEDASDSRRASSPSPQSGKTGEFTGVGATVVTIHNDVVTHLSRMSINSSDPPDDETKQTIATDSEKQKADIQQATDREQDVEVQDKGDSNTDVEQILPLNDNLQRKKPGKKNSMGTRKYSPDQPRIITLDSLGISHSPACSCLKQYLIEELKDKKGIEIPTPGALGMRAKNVPEQTNHCDCGLFLLGYIQEFLKNPDRFVRSLLQNDGEIAWDLNPSRLRNEIRDLIFELQKEQQGREDAHKEEKRNKAALLKRKKPEDEQQPPQHNAPPTKEHHITQGASNPPKEGSVSKEVEASVAQRPRSPTPKLRNLDIGLAYDTEENRHMPGSFPQSPAVEDNNASDSTIAANIHDLKQIESLKFVSPLPESSRGSSPSIPLLVEDPEAPQGQKHDSTRDHGNVEESETLVEIGGFPPSRENRSRSASKGRDGEEQPTTSPYFGGRLPGDRMASATLREEPAQPHEVFDVSD